MRVDLLCTEQAVDALLPGWLDLAHASAASTPYNHPGWVLSWWRQRRHAGLSWRCFAGSDADGKLVALLPLVRYPDGVVRFAGHDLHDSAEALTDRDRLQRLWRAAVVELQRSGNCPVLDLPTLGDRDAAGLNDLGLGSCLSVYDIDPGARLVLPSSWPDYLDGLTASRRKRMRAERRALENDRGSARFEVIRSGADIAGAIGEFWELRETSWHQRGRYDELADHVRGAPMRAFVMELATTADCDADLMAVGRLTAGDALAGAALLLFSGDRVWYAMCAFAPALAKYGPGRLLLSECVRASIETGLTVIELGRGVEEYKFALGATRYELPSVRAAMTP